MAHRPSRRPANAGRRFPAEILTPDEVRALIKACSNRAPTGIRNRALLVLLYRGGLRVSEALRLYPKDLDRAAGTVTVLGASATRAAGAPTGPSRRRSNASAAAFNATMSGCRPPASGHVRRA